MFSWGVINVPDMKGSVNSARKKEKMKERQIERKKEINIEIDKDRKKMREIERNK